MHIVYLQANFKLFYGLFIKGIAYQFFTYFVMHRNLFYCIVELQPDYIKFLDCDNRTRHFTNDFLGNASHKKPADTCSAICSHNKEVDV